MLAAGLWVLVAAVATVIGLVAVNAAGTGVLGTTAEPLTPGQVHAALSRTKPIATTSPSSAATARGVRRTLASAGGTVVAQCANTRVTLLSWSPAQGYEADDISRGPASRASIKFKNDNTELTLAVTCRNGRPTARMNSDRDD